MQPIYMKIPVVPAHHRQPEPAQPESTAPEPTSPEFSYTHSYISAAAEGRDSLIQFARKVTSLDPSVHDKIARENREHAELGLLKDMQTARANTSAFAQSIAAGGKGSDAKNAPYAMAAFQLEQMKTLREKYKDSPAGLRYMENHLGSLAHSSVSDMADYSLKEHQTYKEQIYQGELDAARAILTNWKTPETVRWATLRDLGGKTKAFFSGPDRDAAIDRLEGFLRSAWNEMWLGRLNSLRESDPEAALKLTRDALDYENERKHQAQQNLTHTALAENGPAGKPSGETANIAAPAGQTASDGEAPATAAGLTAPAPANAASFGDSSAAAAPETAPSGEAPASATATSGQTSLISQLAGEPAPAKPARSVSERHLHLYLSPEQLAVEHRKNERAVALQNQKRETEARDKADQRYSALRQSISSLPTADQENLGLAFLNEIPDPILRQRMQTFFASDLERARTAEKASDNAAARAFRAQIARDNLSPAQALTLLPAAQGLSDAARNDLEQSILNQTPAPRETRDNRAALDSLRLAVDNGHITRPEQIEIMAANHGLTDAQTDKALDYLKKTGGNAGPGVAAAGSGSGSDGSGGSGPASANTPPSASRVNDIVRALNNNQGLDALPGFYDRLIQTLPSEPGKPLTEAGLRQCASELLESGRNAEGDWTLGDDDRSWARRLGIDPPEEPGLVPAGAIGNGGKSGGEADQSGDGGILVADAGGSTATDAGGKAGDEAFLLAMGGKGGKTEAALEEEYKAAAKVRAKLKEEQEKKYATLRFPEKQYSQYDPNKMKLSRFLDYSADNELPPELMRYQTELIRTVREQGVKGVLAECNAENPAGALADLADRYSRVTKVEEQLKIKNQLAFLVLGERGYSVYAQNMAVLAGNGNAEEKQKARVAIRSFGDPGFYFTPKFIEQQKAMAEGWRDKLAGAHKEGYDFPGLVRAMKEAPNGEAKKAATAAFLNAAAKAAGMPVKPNGISLASLGSSGEMAHESGQEIVFNMDTEAVRKGDVDQLLERLFHEAGHAWVSGQHGGTKKFSGVHEQQDRDSLSGPLFQSTQAGADDTLYRAQPQERHSQMLEPLSKFAGEPSFGQRWGAPDEVKRSAKSGAKK